MTDIKSDIKPRSNRWYGWKPELPDKRDIKFKVERPFPLKSVSLFEYNTPPVYDQGPLGSCTANALAALGEFFLMNKSTVPTPGAELYMPSRLDLYWYERYIEHTVPFDAGAQIRDGIKVMASRGISNEEVWPYDISKFTEKPPVQADILAAKFKAVKYKRVNGCSKSDIVSALLQGHPVAFGFTVYESFESQAVANTGIVPMPNVSRERVLGGHAVVIWGYNHEEDYFIVRNSWGKDWGIDGYFHMPADYVTDEDLCADFWIIEELTYAN